MFYRTNYISAVLVVIFVGICLDATSCHPVYKEHQPVETLQTTTPKKIKDTFQLNKQVMPIPQNGSNGSKKTQSFTSNVNGKSKYNDIGCDPTGVTYKSPKKQNDGDDDDDDDGGEYEGVSDYGNCKKKEQDDFQDKSKSMPMMIIRQLDVMAMDLPLPSGKKDCKKPLDDDKTQKAFQNLNTDTYNRTADETDRDPCDLKDPAQKVPAHKGKGKEWGAWTPCSKSCGDGIQTRTRLSPSRYPELDTQVRTCNVAECRSAPRMSGDSRSLPSQYKFIELN